MLTKFAAALLATSLIAGSAIAAQPSGMAASNGAAPAVQTQTPATPAAKTVKPANSVKHAPGTAIMRVSTSRGARVEPCIMRGMPTRPKRIRSV